MKIILINTMLVLVAAVAGCKETAQPHPPSILIPVVPHVPAGSATTGAGAPQADPAPQPEKEGPVPDLSRAVEKQEARPAGPVTEARFRRFWSRATLMVLIKTEEGRIRQLQDWLQLADESENEFLERLGIKPLELADTAADQLQGFQRARDRIRSELADANERLRGLQSELARVGSSASANIPEVPLHELSKREGNLVPFEK